MVAFTSARETRNVLHFARECFRLFEDGIQARVYERFGWDLPGTRIPGRQYCAATASDWSPVSETIGPETRCDGIEWRPRRSHVFSLSMLDRTVEQCPSHTELEHRKKSAADVHPPIAASRRKSVPVLEYRGQAWMNQRLGRNLPAVACAEAESIARKHWYARL